MSVYKGENVIAGGSVDTYFVRKPAWSQAETINMNSLLSGSSYTAPADGILIVSTLPGSNQSSITYFVYVNGVKVSAAYHYSANSFSTNTQIQVNQGDVITTDLPTSFVDGFAKFVPFEDSTIAEPEVVTPELIRNLHDPDWSQAEAIVDIKTSRTWTATKRGVITSKIRHDSNNAYIKVNGVIVNCCEHANASEYTVTPVSPGDVVTEEPAGATYATIQFVPYKAQ